MLLVVMLLQIGPGKLIINTFSLMLYTGLEKAPKVEISTGVCLRVRAYLA